jgi:uracil-DNA glycosylase family 4
VGDLEDVLADLAERAAYYVGLSGVGIPALPPAPPRSRCDRTDPEPAAPVAGRPSREAGGGAQALDAVRLEMGDCQRCRLAGGRKTIVFGQGNPSADLMFVGEGPGSEEDEQGLAFVGKAGQLLTRIIEAIGLRREDVFIANVVKCRPPQNRNPEPDEILACKPFLEAQIDAVRPKVLVGLGKFGAQWLLGSAVPITKVRGRLGEYKGIKVMPTYHPAYLLRNPAAKKEVWADMKEVRRLLAE